MSSENSEIFKTLLPYLLGTALFTATLVLGVVKFSQGGAAVTGGSTVSFDVVKYTNAQRAIASGFLKDANNDDPALLLNLSKKTHESINKFAGKRLVILKQAVVQGDVPDITDSVLKDLGLPTEVPTQDPSKYALDVAPTMLALPQAPGPRNSSATAGGSSGSSALP